LEAKAEQRKGGKKESSFWITKHQQSHIPLNPENKTLNTLSPSQASIPYVAANLWFK